MTPPVSSSLFALLASFVALGTGRAEEPPNNDEDVTRPAARFDLRYQFRDKGNGVGQSRMVLRAGRPIPLGNDWKLSTRLDVPFVLSNATSSDNPEGKCDVGMGDVLAQAVLVHASSERFAFVGGLRAVFPTATEDQFGSGKYRLGPILAARYFLPEISPGSFFQPVVRYDFDVGGDDGRKHVSRLHFGPTLNFQFPERWFLTLFPSQDIVLNNIGGHKWFIPADFLIGRNLDERTVASVEVSIPVVKQFTLYDFKLEARLSFSF